MVSVARFDDRFIAEQAAEFLRCHGVPASVVGDPVQGVFGVKGLFFARLDVVILDKRQKEQAQRLISDFNADPPAPDPGWEERTRVDIQHIDHERYPITCPECLYPLPNDKPEVTCPECGTIADVAARLMIEHGPEALAPPEDISAPSLGTTHVPCPACGYSLADLEARGRCPECGGLYDKDDIFRRRRR